jgi:hypothetical protein
MHHAVPTPVPRPILDALDAAIARTEGLLAGRRLGLALRAAVGLGTTRAEGLVRAAEGRLAWLHEQRRDLRPLGGGRVPSAAAGNRVRAAAQARNLEQRQVRRAA